MVSFSLFLDAFPPRPKMPFEQWHVAINIYNICKGHFVKGTQTKDVKCGLGVESACFHGIVNHIETYFVAYYAYFTAELHQF